MHKIRPLPSGDVVTTFYARFYKYKSLNLLLSPQLRKSGWGSTGEADDYEFIQKISLMSVYAPEEMLERIRDYNNSGCAQQLDQEERCKCFWVSVVAELREAIEVEPVEERTVNELLWGS